MTTTPFALERFGGLNLAADPTELGFAGAVDMLDCDIDRDGRVRARSGSLKYNASTLAAAGYQAIYGYAGTVGDIIAIRNPSTGAAVDKIVGGAGTTTNLGTVAGTNPVTFSSAAIGTPTSTVLYMTFVDTFAGVTIRKWDGTTLGSGTGKPTHAATWPTSNRLVQGGYYAAADSPSGANGSRSTVFFSDTGAPDTYTATNFVTLRPGDGEVITAIVSWRDLLFVFKQSAVFVFYGESIDSGGNPIFNYRRVDLPDAVSDPVLTGGTNAAAVYAVPGPDAVYYSTNSGVYRTAGGVPDIFSRALDPIFSVDTGVATSIRYNARPPSLAYISQRLICSYTTNSSVTRQLVWSAATGQWTLWSLPSKVFGAFTPGSLSSLASESIMFPTGNNVAQMLPSYTTDDGAAIAWTYKSGFGRLSDPGRVAITLESRVFGQGTVTLKVANDFGSLDTGSALTLGTSPAIADAWQQIDREGVYWQHQFSGAGGASVNALIHYVSFVKPAGVG